MLCCVVLCCVVLCCVLLTQKLKTGVVKLFPGPFTDVNAEEVEEEVSNMWRTMYKLTKSFSDVPGPKRIADSVKSKIDKFKAHLPLLQTICNPGIRDRHWEQVRSSSYNRNVTKSEMF